VHPYAATPAGVGAAVAGTRALLDRLGDGGRPIWATELGWADAGPASPFTVGRARQAGHIADALRRLAAARSRLKLRGVVYYDWRDVRPNASHSDFFGLHTGLLTVRGARKPAYHSFATAARALHR
ncbi:MAG TPA: hypothetical protein VGI54_08915, partial [Solirubrobacteraceae bacterium]